MAEESVITPELEKLLNVRFGPDVYEIEKGMVKKFAEAVEDTNPAWEEIAPPTFAAALVPKGLIHEIFNVECPLKRVLNGASELEYIEPIKIGDTISVTATLTRLRQMSGQDGPTLFMFTEVTWTNQDGEVAVKGKNTYIRY